MSFFNLFWKNIKMNQKKKKRGNDFIFESADSLYYSLHKICLNKGGSYTDSPDWIKQKKQQ